VFDRLDDTECCGLGAAASVSSAGRLTKRHAVMILRCASRLYDRTRLHAILCELFFLKYTMSNTYGQVAGYERWAGHTQELTHLVAVREEVTVSVAPDKLAKLPLRFHGRHGAVIQSIILAGAREVLVGVRDAIGVEIHASLPSWLEHSTAGGDFEIQKNLLKNPAAIRRWYRRRSPFL